MKNKQNYNLRDNSKYQMKKVNQLVNMMINYKVIEIKLETKEKENQFEN